MKATGFEKLKVVCWHHPFEVSAQTEWCEHVSSLYAAVGVLPSASAKHARLALRL